MELTKENVSKLFVKCLFTEKEVEEATKAGETVPTLEAVIVHGAVGSFGLHPERLKTVREEVVSLLQQLPEEFHEGTTFLNAVLTKDCTPWGEQRNANELLVMGMGLGYVKEMLPKQFRHSLVGGVPYYQVTV